MEKPNLTFQQCKEIGSEYGIQTPFILGNRNLFGTPNTYCDAVAVVDSTNFFVFNFDTSPSTEIPGEATLLCGAWAYKLGIHGLDKPPSKRYPALVQAEEVTVTRYKEQGTFTGFFGINIHRGGVNSTGSAGCQTVPPDQWQQFFFVVRNLMAMDKLEQITYLLVEEK